MKVRCEKTWRITPAPRSCRYVRESAAEALTWKPVGPVFKQRSECQGTHEIGSLTDAS